jgi:hypothetical protein
MEFVDTCLTISIKRFRKISSTTLFSKSFTVTSTQEYELTLNFHSLKIKKFTRYSHLLEFKSTLPETLQLPPFPKKALISKSCKLAESRQGPLEAWLRALILNKAALSSLLEFLKIPESIIFSVKKSTGCLLTSSDKIVASFIKKLGKISKTGKKLIKDFDNRFFENSEVCLSPSVLSSFFSYFFPLCSNFSVACEAIEVLFKMLRIECYRFADFVKEQLVDSLEILKEVQLEKHILNEFGQQTGIQGYFIAGVVKDLLDRKGLEQRFQEILNFRNDAFEMFQRKVEGKGCGGERKSFMSKSQEWNSLCTDNYSAGLKIAFRKKEFIEVRAEVLIASKVQTVEKFFCDRDKRKAWDMLLDDFVVVRRERNESLVKCYLRKDKKTLFDLNLKIITTKTPEKTVFSFESNQGEVSLHESFYEISQIEEISRVSSSSTDDQEVNIQAEASRLKSCEVLSKVVLQLKMSTSLARYFVSDLSEETSLLKDSLNNLRHLCESC